MKIKQLNEILELHEKWLKALDGGVRADLSYADLRGIDLSGINLSYADLMGANLKGANLRYIDLSCAKLIGANLSDTDLKGANLNDTDLSYANLMCANLSETDLTEADLSDADLTEANLRFADLTEADLSYADLSYADLMCTDLRGANLSGVRINLYTSFFALQCPEKGSFTAFKKAGNYVIELLIPASAKRSSATSRKCRASKAKVVAIYNLDGTKSRLTSIKSDYDESFIYEIGKTLKVKDFDDDRWNECSTGIHFFITFDEAKLYNI